MLHHSNVDRLVAMWQVISYNETMFTGTANSTGQFATIENSTITSDSPLKPFFDENMSFHTSNSVANISKFGYTYPEMPDWGMPPEARAGHVRAQVNSLFSRGVNSLGQTRGLNRAGRFFNLTNYYTAEITVDRCEMPLPSIMRLMVGRKAVGRLSLLGMPSEGMVSVSLPIQDMLIGNQSMRDLPLQRVVLFLQANLTAEILKARPLPLCCPTKSSTWLTTDSRHRVMAPRYR